MKNRLPETFLRVHYLLQRSELMQEASFQTGIRILTRDTLDNVLTLLKSPRDADTLSECFLKNISKFPMTQYSVQKYTETTMGQIILTGFLLAFFRLWFDGSYRQKVCQVKVLQQIVYKDPICPAIKKYRDQLLTEMTLLYFYLVGALKVNLAMLSSVPLSPALRKHLRLL